jgi:SAM-dependent methyltransferase
MTEPNGDPVQTQAEEAAATEPTPGPRYIGDLFDMLADDYDSMRGEVGWDPWPHLRAALGNGTLEGKLILDVGCGTGEVAEQLIARGASVIGVDASPRMCELAAARAPAMRCFVHALGAGPMPFEDDIFDAVVALGCVEFAPDPAAACAELVRVARPGGTLLWVTELCGNDCAAGGKQDVVLYEEWRRYRLPFTDAVDVGQSLLSGVTNVRVPGYEHDDTGERVVYLRTIGNKPGTTPPAA